MSKKAKKELKKMSIPELIAELNKINKRIGDPPVMVFRIPVDPKPSPKRQPKGNP